MHYTPFIALIIFTIIELLLLHKFRVTKEKTAIKSTTFSLVFLWLIFIAIYFHILVIPDIVYILVIISFFMDSYFGYYLKMYYKSKKYDRLQHMFGSFSSAIFFYFFFSNIFEYGGSKAFQAFYILTLGVFFGTVFEIVEFISDLKNKEKMQRGLRDTNFDMVSDVIGSLLASILAFFVFL